jgi:hypothetical protein
MLMLGMLFALIGIYSYGHHEGYSQREAEDAFVIAAKDKAMDSAKEKSDEELRKTQQQLTVQQGKLRDAIRVGDQRLYVRVATPTECSSTSNGDSTTTAQLDPEFASSLVSITDRGDQAIVQLNACIKSYNEMRGIVNGDK